MRYESESRTWGIAAREISRRTRAMPEFQEARALVIDGAAAECRGADVAGMRALGGFTAVVERHVSALPDRFRVDCGSKLLPSSVAAELRCSEVAAMVSDVKERCSTEPQWANHTG